MGHALLAAGVDTEGPGMDEAVGGGAYSGTMMSLPCISCDNVRGC